MRPTALDALYARVRDGLVESYLTDALGSVLKLRDAAQTRTVSYTYDPYGGTHASGTSNNTVKYTGREEDLGDLYYYRHRYYKPSIGRFLSEDPIGLAGGENLYTYVAGNPINFIDPTGEFIHIAVGGVIGGLSGLIGALNDPCATSGSIAQAIAVGAVLGGVSAAVPIGGSLAAAAARNALAGFTGNSAGQLVTGGASNYNIGQAVTQGVVGGISGGAGNAAGFATGLGMARSGATAAEAISTSLGVGTTAAIGTGVGLNLALPGSVGGLNSAGGSSNCGCGQ